MNFRKSSGIPKISRSCQAACCLATIFEWSQDGTPTILGLSDGIHTVSVPWVDGLDRFKEILRDRPETEWVLHNGAAADLIVLEKLGLHIPLEKVWDTIILHWLVNPNLAKSSGKQALEEDAGEKRGRGFFNLWTMLSMYTDFYNYKSCRGTNCTGACPEHRPFEYNGLDALGPVLALPALRRQAQLRGVDKLYSMHRELAYVLAQIQEFGVRVDMPYVAKLNEQFNTDKDRLESTFEFNPRSPKAVLEYFKEKHDLVLRDAQESTIQDTIDELDGGAPDDLVSLAEFKALGNGCDRWFKRQYRNKNGWIEGYVDDNDYAHPRVAMFTSSGRLMCSGPNFQNIGKRRKSVGKAIRKAVIAPPGWYIVRADLSNAEGRTILWHAGYKDVPGDVHQFMVNSIGLKEDEPFSQALGSARDAAKSVTHASNYMEGLQLKTREELRSPRIRKEIDFGARIVFPDWVFKGKIVTFTGVNLANRVLKSKTLENRKWALDVMSRYIDKTFPEIRTFQKKVCRQVEVEGCIRPLHGYVLPNYDPRPEDQMKTAISIWGQQTTAHLNKLAILDVWQKFKAGRPMRPYLPCHDELLCYVHESVPPEEAMGWIKESMELKLPEMPDLRIPADPTWGPSWAEQNKPK